MCLWDETGLSVLGWRLGDFFTLPLPWVFIAWVLVLSEHSIVDRVVLHSRKETCVYVVR